VTGSIVERPPSAVARAAVCMFVGAVLAVFAAVACGLALRRVSTAAPAYLGALAAAGTPDNFVLTDLRSALRYNLAIDLAAALLLALLGWAVRHPWRSARITAWGAATALSIGLTCGVAAGPENLVWRGAGDPAPVVQAREALLLGWYPTAHNLAAGALAIALVTAALALLRTSAADFYRRPHANRGPSLGALVRDRRPS
jgi:hypothetical protein